jgi:hypothetical protein
LAQGGEGLNGFSAFECRSRGVVNNPVIGMHSFERIAFAVTKLTKTTPNAFDYVVSGGNANPVARLLHDFRGNRKQDYYKHVYDNLVN